MSRTRSATMALTAVTLAAVLGVCVAPSAGASSGPVGAADFYTPPTPMPKLGPGSVVRAEPSVDAVIPGTPAVVDAEVTRLMYTSTNVADDSVAVTGTLLVPRLSRAGTQPRPLVALGPGTQGLGDQCAPSKLMTFGQEYENLQIGALLAAGYSVAVTDYIGLGTPGVHPYLNRVDEGRALLDIARAARSMTAQGMSADAPVALWGYSQGGHAAGAAAELASSYAPELPIVGAFVGAPAPNLFDLAEYGDGSVLSGGIGWVVSGLMAAYPDRADELLSIFNAQGRELLARSQEYCVYDALRMNPFGSTTSYTRDGQPISAYLDTEPLATLAAAQSLGTLTPSMPIYLAQNAGDDFVAARGTAALGRDWCAGGATVQSLLVPIPEILPKTGLGHILGIPTFLPALQWLEGRFDKIPAPSSC